MSGQTLGVIGGSGLYEIAGLVGVEEVSVETPFGPPSDVVIRGRLGSTTLLFLPRHGRGHRFAPHEIPFRANVCAMKKLGATHLVSISAVGSMKEAIAPGDFVVVDQLVDLTKRRPSTFLEDGLVGHVGCAESLLYRSWGVSVIGMTALPEAKLAREAELPYALLALATDYDCWHESEEDVSVQAVLAVMKTNVVAARKTVAELAGSLPDGAASRASTALASAIMTAHDRVSPAARARLDWLVGKYL